MADEAQTIGGIGLALTLDTSQFDAAVARSESKLKAIGTAGYSNTVTVPLRRGAGLAQPAYFPGQAGGGGSNSLAVTPVFTAGQGAIRKLRTELAAGLRGEAIPVSVALGRTNFAAMRREIAAGIGAVPITVTYGGGSKGGALDVVTAVVAQASGISKVAARQQIRGAMASHGVDPGSLEKRERGGHVRANVPFLAGERGPELVTPRTSGMVTPAHEVARLRREYEALHRAMGGYARAAGGRYTKADFPGVYDNLRRTLDRGTPEQIAFGRKWYPGEGQLLRARAGERHLTPEALAAIVAKFSQNSPWPANLGHATSFVDQLQRGIPVEQMEVFATMVARRQALPVALGKVDPSTILKGPKETPFAHALLGDTSAVPVDRWMNRAAGYPFNLRTGKVANAAHPILRDLITEGTHRLAQETGEVPSGMQAILWDIVGGGRDPKTGLRRARGGKAIYKRWTSRPKYSPITAAGAERRKSYGRSMSMLRNYDAQSNAYYEDLGHEQEFWDAAGPEPDHDTRFMRAGGWAHAYRQTIANRGGTFDAGGHSPKRGYAVELGQGPLIPEGNPRAFAKAYRQMLGQGPYVGTWIPEGDNRIWMGSSDVLGRRRDAERLALRQAQHAYYDIRGDKEGFPSWNARYQSPGQLKLGMAAGGLVHQYGDPSDRVAASPMVEEYFDRIRGRRASEMAAVFEPKYGGNYPGQWRVGMKDLLGVNLGDAQTAAPSNAKRSFWNADRRQPPPFLRGIATIGNLAGTLVAHNHPGRKGELWRPSPHDVEFMLANRVRQMTILTKGHTFTMRPGRVGGPVPDASAIAHSMFDVLGGPRVGGSQSRINHPLSTQLWSEAMEEVADRFGINWELERHAPRAPRGEQLGMFRAQGGPAKAGGLPRGYRMEFITPSDEETEASQFIWARKSRGLFGKKVTKPTELGSAKTWAHTDVPMLAAVVYNRRGEVAAHAPFTVATNKRTGEGYLHPELTEVEPGHEGKGLANAMYVKAERFTGKQVRPAVGDQTQLGQGLWLQKNRPFGKRYEDEVNVIRESALWSLYLNGPEQGYRGRVPKHWAHVDPSLPLFNADEEATVARLRKQFADRERAARQRNIDEGLTLDTSGQWVSSPSANRYTFETDDEIPHRAGGGPADAARTQYLRQRARLGHARARHGSGESDRLAALRLFGNVGTAQHELDHAFSRLTKELETPGLGSDERIDTMLATLPSVMREPGMGRQFHQRQLIRESTLFEDLIGGGKGGWTFPMGRKFEPSIADLRKNPLMGQLPGSWMPFSRNAMGGMVKPISYGAGFAHAADGAPPWGRLFPSAHVDLSRFAKRDQYSIFEAAEPLAERYPLTAARLRKLGINDPTQRAEGNRSVLASAYSDNWGRVTFGADSPYTGDGSVRPDSFDLGDSGSPTAILFQKRAVEYARRRRLVGSPPPTAHEANGGAPELVDPSIGGIFTHEFGHAVDNMHGIYPRYKPETKSNLTVSKYAYTDRAENFAELFTAAERGKNLKGFDRFPDLLNRLREREKYLALPGNSLNYEERKAALRATMGITLPDDWHTRARASGGDARGGPYIVNENGRELFVPMDKEGAIPPDVAAQIPGGGGLLARIRAREAGAAEEDLSGKPAWMRRSLSKDMTHRAGGGIAEINQQPWSLFSPPEDGWIVPAHLKNRVPRAATGRLAGGDPDEPWQDANGNWHAGRTSQFVSKPVAAATQRRVGRRAIDTLHYGGLADELAAAAPRPDALIGDKIEERIAAILNPTNTRASPKTFVGAGALRLFGGGQERAQARADVLEADDEIKTFSASYKKKLGYAVDPLQHISEVLTKSEDAYKASSLAIGKNAKETLKLQRVHNDAAKDNVVLQNAYQKRAKGLEVLEKPQSAIKGLLALQGSFAGYQLALTAISSAIQIGAQQATKAIDRASGYQLTENRVTSGLGDQLRTNGGNLGVTLAQAGLNAGAGTGLTDALRGLIGPSITAKAGAKAEGDVSDLFRSGIANIGGKVPKGLYQDYGGLFGGPLLAEFLGGGSSLTKLIGENLSAQPPAPAGVGGIREARERNYYLQHPEDLAKRHPELAAQYAAAQAATAGLKTAYVKDLNDAVQRGAVASGDAASGLTLVAGQSKDVTDQFSKVAKAAGVASDTVDQIANSGYALVDSQGKAVTSTDDVNKYFLQLAAGRATGTPDQYVRANQLSLQAAKQVSQAQGELERKLLSPYSFAEGLYQNPVVPGQAAAALAGVTPRNANNLFGQGGTQLASGLGARLEAVQTGQDQLMAQARQDVAAMVSQISTAISPQAATEYSSAMDKVLEYGTIIANKQVEVTKLQSGLHIAEISNNLRLASRSLKDALGVAGQGGGSRYGALERQQTLLGFNLQQRQINLSVATAGFQVPGETMEERAARQQDAIIQAQISQKQLDIQKALFDIIAARGVTDTGATVKLLQRAQTVEAQVITINAEIALNQNRQARAAAVAASYVTQATRNINYDLNVASDYVAHFGGTVEDARLKLRDVLGLGKQIIGYKDDGRPIYGATGFMGTTLGPTGFVAGEVKGEHVTILKNPTYGTLSSGGGSGSITIQISIPGVVVREQSDITALAREVEDRLSRRLAILRR